MAKKRLSVNERAVAGERCAVLSDDGQRCRKPAVGAERYHGDSEIYSAFDEPRIGWVRVPMCHVHLPRKAGQ